MKMTNTEAIVYALYTQEGLTARQIAARLKKTPSNINVVLHRIRKKGLVSLRKLEPPKEGGEVLTKVTKVRLHAQQFRVGILWASPSYEELLRGCNELRDFEGAYVRLYPKIIEIYSQKEFYGADEEEAFKLALSYWTQTARRLEQRLNILLIKPGGRNWKAVKSGEYAREGAEMAVAAELNGHKVIVRTTEDGKAWYLVDWSRKEPEDETVHPVTSKEDRGTVDYYVNDWRDNHPPNNSGLYENLKELSYYTKETAAGLAVMVKLQQPPPQAPREEGVLEKPFYVG